MRESVRVCERESVRERERGRDTENERERERQRQRDRERERERERETDRQTDRQTERSRPTKTHHSSNLEQSRVSLWTTSTKTQKQKDAGRSKSTVKKRGRTGHGDKHRNHDCRSKGQITSTFQVRPPSAPVGHARADGQRFVPPGTPPSP